MTRLLAAHMGCGAVSQDVSEVFSADSGNVAVKMVTV